MWRRLLFLFFILAICQVELSSAKKSRIKRSKYILKLLLLLVKDVKQIMDDTSLIPDIQSELKDMHDWVEEMQNETQTLIKRGFALTNVNIKKQCQDDGLLSRLVKDEEGYYLAFRMTAGIPKIVYDKYTAVGINDDDNDLIWNRLPRGCLSTNSSHYCDRHFRSVLLDLWPRIPVDKVRVAAYKNGELKSYFFFNGTDSTYLDFFRQERLVDSNYIDLSSSEPSNPGPNYFSIEGHVVNEDSKRRFYISNNYGGCANDAGWLVVLDGTGPGLCTWENQLSYPYILYGRDGTKSVWDGGNPGQADVLTVSIKFNETLR